ncbi:hypothetical protein [Actinomadura algeriensis]|uniref:Uncharacterized protein n=1 Tax=Actinomadura algeriensis TaxID=1679523 RepID=A0ABR9JQL5_9ACTN|nr:hypothetical protein [Actinomadura algeriensis]MBE1532817.1 hypothetical protein [Actinomadura algeriensis]
MPKPAQVAIAVTALAAGLTAASPASAAPAQPEGRIVVFVTEGAEISWAGTELREFAPSSSCQAFPAGAHVVANHSTGRLLFFADPFCLTPVPPPFNFIPPGHGAHVSPTGSFRVG